MNTNLVDSLIQIIQSLSEEERHILDEKLFFEHDFATTKEIQNLAQKGHSFAFLNHEPDIYTLEDGTPI